MSFEAIVDDSQWTTHDGHPMITIAHHEPIAKNTTLSWNFGMTFDFWVKQDHKMELYFQNISRRAKGSAFWTNIGLEDIVCFSRHMVRPNVIPRFV